MLMYDIIDKKRRGTALTSEEICYFIDGFTAGDIPDYQASALLMAVCLNGMTEDETTALTMSMAHSGDTIDLSCFGNLCVDKHSTGGVGDKTTLIVAPIAAALGCKVAKMSGRGLGHTGGTIDKLESIPGYRTSLSQAEFIAQVQDIGIAVIGQTGNLAPADKKLYALRDVTATVDSIPLITSSIMSKKLAAGAHSVVLDVKCGSGAFMKTPRDAETLAGNMVKIGKLCGKNMAALITNMDSPLGCAVGNALEVKEAVSLLRGEIRGDLYDICVALCANMASNALGIDEPLAIAMVERTIKDGSAFNKMKQWISAQGGDVRYLENTALFKNPEYSLEVKASANGFITAMDAQRIGTAALTLGAGRTRKEDAVDPSAGIVIKKKTGDYVSSGEVLCVMYTDNKPALENAEQLYCSAVILGAQKPPAGRLIYKVIK